MSKRITAPCIKVCAKDRETGWCVGCGRTGPEIARWWNITEEERAAARAELPRRLAAMGLPSHGQREAGLARARAQSLAAAAAIMAGAKVTP